MKITPEYLMTNTGLELLNKIFYSAGEGIIIVDNKGNIVMANSRARNLFEYEESELLGKPMEVLIPSKYREQHVKQRNGYLKKPVARPMGLGLDLEGLKKSGNTFPLEISLSHLEHDSNPLVVAFITDITKRKEQELALHESRQQLEDHAESLASKVKARTKELEHLNLGLKSQIRERKLAESALQESLMEVKRAEQDILKSLEKEKELNEMKSRFISMASHEFRTPLTTILSSANLIGKYQEEEQQDKRLKHIDRIQQAVNNLTHILNDFLSLEKLESGKLALNLEKFDFGELLSDLVEGMEQILKKDQAINTHIGNIKTIISDPHLIKNILINLLSNAIKYSKEGAEIWLSAESSNDTSIEIRIRDQGIGIPKEEQHNLFGRFFRAGNATNIQGTGLGLNIVKRYIDLLGGEITFSSEEGVGSEFIVKFPVAF